LSLDFLKQNGDPTLKLIFESLLPWPGVKSVASDSANNPDQQRFDFLDDSYPVLDNLRRTLPDFNDLYYRGERGVETDEAILIAEISFVLNQRLDKVLSPPARDGFRAILPRSTLEQRKVLSGMRILNIAGTEEATSLLTALGAEVKPVSPYDAEIGGKELEVNDEKRIQTAKRLETMVKELTHGQEVFDLVLADRSSIYFALGGVNEVSFGWESPSTEKIIKAVNPNRYLHIASLGDYGVITPPTACEIFAAKESKLPLHTPR
jgi:hypothetical protein